MWALVPMLHARDYCLVTQRLIFLGDDLLWIISFSVRASLLCSGSGFLCISIAALYIRQTLFLVDFFFLNRLVFNFIPCIF